MIMATAMGAKKAMHGIREHIDLTALMMYSEGMTRQDGMQGKIDILRRHATKSARYAASKS